LVVSYPNAEQFVVIGPFLGVGPEAGNDPQQVCAFRLVNGVSNNGLKVSKSALCFFGHGRSAGNFYPYRKQHLKAFSHSFP
jgi:hypothetical protein